MTNVIVMFMAVVFSWWRMWQ